MWDIEFEEPNAGVRPDISIRWSLSFKQNVVPQEPITYHVRQPTVCSSLWPVSICGSSIPVYTYLRDFQDPNELKLQRNTVNQQAHQYLRYFFMEAGNDWSCSCWECSGGKTFTWIDQEYGQHGRSDQADQDFSPQVFWRRYIEWKLGSIHPSDKFQLLVRKCIDELSASAALELSNVTKSLKFPIFHASECLEKTQRVGTATEPRPLEDPRRKYWGISSHDSLPLPP